MEFLKNFFMFLSITGFGCHKTAEGKEILMSNNDGGVLNATEGDHLVLVCETDKGDAREKVEFLWLRNDINVSYNNSMIREENNKTTSIFHFTPTRKDESFMCNIYLKSEREKSFTLDFHVFYRPEVEVTYRGDPEENYFYQCECFVLSANPTPHSYEWHKDGKLIEGEKKNILRFRKITRNNTGNYSCTAINTIGNNTSVPMLLKVKYKPVCQQEQETKYFFEIGQTMNVTCNVDGHPAPHRYSYSWRSSVGNNINDNTRTISYTVQNASDVLECRASNQNGKQRTWCRMTLSQENLPKEVSLCNVSQLEDEVNVELTCQAGSGGGLQQRFMLVIQNETGIEILRRTNSSSSYFIFERFGKCQQYNITVYAINDVGNRTHSDVHYENDICINSSSVWRPKHEYTIPPVIVFILVVIVIVVIVFSYILCCHSGKRKIKDDDDNDMTTTMMLT